MWTIFGSLKQLTLLIWQLQCITSSSAYAEQDTGFGIDLTPSYGAIAVSYANGSNVALARIDGDKNYQKVMYWLAVDSRYLSAEDVAVNQVILHEMLRSLVALGSAELGYTIKAASVTLPCHNRVHHYGDFSVEQIMREAFSATDLEYLKIVKWPMAGEPLLFVENAQLAGHGLQICQPYTTSNQTCYLDLPKEVYLMVGYYGNALEITQTGYVQIAYQSWFNPNPAWHLGADVLPRDALYWDHVRYELIKVLTYFRRKISKVVIYGDHADNEMLREVLAEVLRKTGNAPEYVGDTIDSTFVGAIGAAEFSKRQPYFSGKEGWLASSQRPARIASDQQVIV